jgi:hypothetical protein
MILSFPLMVCRHGGIRQALKRQLNVIVGQIPEEPLQDLIDQALINCLPSI